MIQFTCPACSKRLQVPKSAAGKQARCTCQELVRVPQLNQGVAVARRSPPAQTQASAQPVSPSPTQAGKVIACQACGKRLKLPASWAPGKVLRCPCGESLQPGGSTQSARPATNTPRKTAVAVAPASNDLFAELPGSFGATSGSQGDFPVSQFRGTAPSVPNTPVVATRSTPHLNRVAADFGQPSGPQQRSFLNSNTLTGLLMMIGAVVWFTVGLFVGIIFFYPPVLFVLGLVQFVRGLFGN